MAPRIVAIVLALMAVTATPHASAEPTGEITLTFIRHAESAGNTSGFIDGLTPGPGLTELGWSQARDVAINFGDRGFGTGFDGIFASSMVRTQETAQFLAERLGEPVDVLPGLREVEAGNYEGQPTSAVGPYFDVLRQWAAGNREARVPGAEDGNEFDHRFDDAVATIYATGHQRPVAFSHGGAIAIWVIMNARNADPALLDAKPLNNTGYVVVHGSPSAGWTLVDWDGETS